jgi:hypothetical protein
MAVAVVLSACNEGAPREDPSPWDTPPRFPSAAVVHGTVHGPAGEAIPGAPIVIRMSAEAEPRAPEGICSGPATTEATVMADARGRYQHRLELSGSSGVLTCLTLVASPPPDEPLELGHVTRTGIHLWLNPVEPTGQPRDSLRVDLRLPRDI